MYVSLHLHVRGKLKMVTLSGSFTNTWTASSHMTSYQTWTQDSFGNLNLPYKLTWTCSPTAGFWAISRSLANPIHSSHSGKLTVISTSPSRSLPTAATVPTLLAVTPAHPLDGSGIELLTLTLSPICNEGYKRVSNNLLYWIFWKYNV